MKTDTQVQQDVIAELEWDLSLNATQIGVEVKDGIVTLAGHVNSFSEKWAAERAAQRVSGVKALAVEIDVKLFGFSNRSDADIARAVENVLQWTTNLPMQRVKILVEKGWITLSGEVEWEYQRLAAANALRDLMGVTGVSNEIAVQVKKSTDSIRSSIESALKRRAKPDAPNIQVDIEGDRVTLTGVVYGWLERDMARHSAWGTPGVREVVDHLTLAS
jgi:osmotically-inducible protein OsmY